MLVCVEREARFHDAIVESRRLGGQHPRRLRPARPRTGWPPAAGRCTASSTASPTHRAADRGGRCSTGALATLECRTTDVHPGGDHSIVVGEVRRRRHRRAAGDALLYYRGRYETLA